MLRLFMASTNMALLLVLLNSCTTESTEPTTPVTTTAFDAGDSVVYAVRLSKLSANNLLRRMVQTHPVGEHNIWWTGSFFPPAFRRSDETVYLYSSEESTGILAFHLAPGHQSDVVDTNRVGPNGEVCEVRYRYHEQRAPLVFRDETQVTVYRCTWTGENGRGDTILSGTLALSPMYGLVEHVLQEHSLGDTITSIMLLQHLR